MPGGPTAATDARGETSGSTWTPGFNVGVMFQPDEATRFGLHYRSQMRHKIGGTAVTSGLTGPLAFGNGATGASAMLKLPAVVTAGASRRINDKLTLYGEVDWYGWGTLNELRIRFDNGTADAVRPENYRNTFAYALGAEYAQSDVLTLRGGVQLDYTPTVDGFRDTTVPDANRLVFAAGASYRVSKQMFLDFAVNHVKFRTATVSVTRSFFDGTALASSVTVNDVVALRINTLSAQIRYAF
jgi:long-chain fatty acid transport protein